MKVTLKNGEIREFAHPTSAYEAAASISTGLAKKACAAEINGESRGLENRNYQ